MTLNRPSQEAASGTALTQPPDLRISIRSLNIFLWPASFQILANTFLSIIAATYIQLLHSVNVTSELL
jgi:hypothetical protein